MNGFGTKLASERIKILRTVVHQDYSKARRPVRPSTPLLNNEERIVFRQRFVPFWFLPHSPQCRPNLQGDTRDNRVEVADATAQKMWDPATNRYYWRVPILTDKPTKYTPEHLIMIAGMARIDFRVAAPKRVTVEGSAFLVLGVQLLSSKLLDHNPDLVGWHSDIEPWCILKRPGQQVWPISQFFDTSESLDGNYPWQDTSRISVAKGNMLKATVQRAKRLGSHTSSYMCG